MASLGAQPVTVLTQDECWTLLASEQVGRLATSVVDQPEIFPVNFACRPPSILIRTAEGTKLLSTAINERVAFEADAHTATDGWSVVVKGRVHLLSTQAEEDAAERYALRSWVPLAKQRYLRIDVTQISGRRFVFGPEPDAAGGPEPAD
ncbi:MAG TPA: pyridoxamine 5'-phosphate oxidase family protein [Jatrophihabitans sp.]|nr:pyridoxamine 5'-phosphate oxidase family protein [Jatrophihabitans sp.]